MLKVFLAAVVFVGLCVLGLGFNIFFRKGGHFPNTDISTNPDMQRLGIKCPRQEELEMLSSGAEAGEGRKPSSCSGEYTEACKGCSLYGMH